MLGGVGGLEGAGRVVYLDHAATTPLRPEALAAMLPVLTDRFGNPSGSHRLARQARAVLEDARHVVAEAFGVDLGDVVFCSGGTEAANQAIATGAAGGLVLCPASEHHAVLEPAKASGGIVLAVDKEGAVDLDALEDALRERSGSGVGIVSVMAANNETGVISPLQEVAVLVREYAPSALIHTDAVQAIGWADPKSLVAHCDLVSLSAHKFGGPKGVGVLVRASSRAAIRPLIRGGSQERNRRAGTPDLAGIAGMAAAMRQAERDRLRHSEALRRLGDRLAWGLAEAIDGLELTVSRERRVPGILHCSIDGVEAEELLVLLDSWGICASAGASCASGATEPSHVLQAMGWPARRARSAIRLSLGWTSSAEEVDLALEAIPKAVSQLRR
jgi:cysteine desulfurase